jgi:predicted dehydrogenase
MTTPYKERQMSQLAIGIVGTGNIAHRHVEELARISDQVKITAAVDLAADRAQWLTDQTGASFYPSVAEALDHIDAALVTTPPRGRVEVIRTLAEAGKAILCEKPIAGTVEEAHEIAELIERTGVPFMAGFMRRWHPPYAELKRLIESGEMGRPLQLTRRRMGYIDLPADNWRVTSNQLTGITIESVSHDIDLLRWLGGEIVEVSGEVLESHAHLPGYDDMMAATLRFESGATGLLQVSWCSPVSENQVGVYGSEMAAVIDGAGMWRSDRMRTGTPASPDSGEKVFDEDVAEEWGNRGQTETFVALARGEDVPHPGIADGVASVEISYQILNASHGR